MVHNGIETWTKRTRRLKLLNTEYLKKFVELEKRKIELETEINKVKGEILLLEPHIIDNLATEGIKNITVDGRTIFTKENFFAVVSSKEEAIEALRKAGYGDMINEGYNTNKLSALIREMKNENQELPEAFENRIKIGSKFVLRSNKNEG